MAQKLTGKVAIVTGSGSEVGIGKEVAIALASEGAKVVVNDICLNKDGTKGADKTSEIITKSGGKAIPSYDSIITMQGAANLINTAVKNFGRLDILVNTAANWVMKPTVEHTEADWDSIMNVQLKGLFACSQAAIKEMIKQKSGGRIINFISGAAFTATMGPGSAIAYSTAKAGIAGFTNSLSLELQKYNITVNAISPVALTKLFPDERVVSGTKAVGPEFVAPLVAYLTTDDAKDITGQFIFISGGDIRILARPFQEPEAIFCAHKEGKWTIDELIKLMPNIIKGK
jgi:NAD(P)-dependent dehydrogenase (short-subunit alcohol dehydrogenase family)